MGKLKSGLPLGGIGCGKFEILSNGLLDNFTIQNNAVNPLGSPDNTGLLGFHFGAFIQTKNKKVAKLLQTQKLSHYPTVENIEYEAVFPFVKLSYKDKGLPVDISLEANSNFIPFNIKDSSLPAVFLSFVIKNKAKNGLDFSLLIIARNIIGECTVGRLNRIKKNKKFIALNLTHALPQPKDSFGDLNINVPYDKDFKISFLNGWNMQKEPFVFNQENINLAAWDNFKNDGTLPNIEISEPVPCQSFELGSSLAIKIKIKAGQSKTIPVIFNWFFHKTYAGNFYETKFKNVSAVSKYSLTNRNVLYKKTNAFSKKILALDLPYWLKEAMLNNLYPLISSSLYLKDKRFSLYEAPKTCPLMGTLDVRFYGSLPILFFFQELELNELMQFARAQRPDGYIPHDLGSDNLDTPSNGTTPLFWKDLNSKFILLVYRDFFWTGNRAFLDQIYPHTKKALEWLMATDKNKDFLPDNEGQDTTFDVWKLFGASSYTSSLYLASLLAMRKLSEFKRDKVMRDKTAMLLEPAEANFTKKLWTKGYFLNYNDGKTLDTSCTVSQLMGAWYCHMLGLGYIVSRDKLRSSLENIFSLNAKASKFGAPNALNPLTGAPDEACLHSQHIWIGINYAFCALAIYEGFAKEALALAKKAWENISLRQNNPWNQPDMINTSTGAFMFGDHYMRNMVIWAIPLALSKQNKNLANFFQNLRSGHV